MSDEVIDSPLKRLTVMMRQHYPRLNAEAIVIFGVISGHDGIALSTLAETTRFTEKLIKEQLLLLIPTAGAGLVQIDNQGIEMTLFLTPAGKRVVESLGI